MSHDSSGSVLPSVLLFHFAAFWIERFVLLGLLGLSGTERAADEKQRENNEAVTFMSLEVMWSCEDSEESWRSS